MAKKKKTKKKAAGGKRGYCGCPTGTVMVTVKGNGLNYGYRCQRPKGAKEVTVRGGMKRGGGGLFKAATSCRKAAKKRKAA